MLSAADGDQRDATSAYDILHLIRICMNEATLASIHDVADVIALVKPDVVSDAFFLGAVRVGNAP